MKKNKSGRWIDIQRKFVKDNVDILTIEEMSEILNKSVNSIKFRCYKVGLKYKSKNDWIKCFIFLSFYDTTLYELSEYLNVTYSEVKKICHSLGLYKGKRDKDYIKIGNKYGNLTVLRPYYDKDDPIHCRKWECACSCGNIKIFRFDYLKQSKYLDCGCTTRWYRTREGYEDISGRYWHVITRNAIHRNIELNITIEYAWEIFLQQNKLCAISNIPINLCKLPKNFRKGEQTASLDRIDSSKGYVEGNIRWVHKHVNVMKMDMSDDEFYNWCKLIYEHLHNK